jgi:preprotein translocase subunit SecF
MGGETTKWFVFALLVGTIAGTYSSTFTAAPLLVIWDKFFSKR